MSDTGSSSSASASSSEVFDTSQIIPGTGQVDPANPSANESTELPTSSQQPDPQAHHLSDVSKPTPLTAPTRSWMSQRVAKTIHIDQDDSIKSNNDSLEIKLDPTPSSSSRRIIELGIVEDQLSQLLSLASDVLGSLTPPLNQDQSITDQAIESFSTSIGEYYELLNKIQLGLRTSMAHLRVARISTRILFEPAHVRVPNCPVGLGDVRLNDPSAPPSSSSAFDINQENPDRDGSALSLGSLIAERNAWKDFVDSLESIKALHSLNPSS